MITKSIYPLVVAAALGLNGGDAKSAEYCYAPTESNVSYTDVTKLAVETPDQLIQYSDQPLQYAELWLPSKRFSARKPPLVVLIHGGCWLNAYDITHTQALSTALRHSGYAVWSLEYRRTGDAGGGWPGSFDDIKHGIEHALSSEQNDFDNTNVAVIGHSAGGHLALLAGAHFKHKRMIKAVIGLAPIVDIEKYANGDNSCELATSKFIGGTLEQMPMIFAQANPAKLEMHPNTVLLHGSLDTIVNPEQSTYLQNAQRVLINGAGHFDMVHPATPSFQALLKQLALHL